MRFVHMADMHFDTPFTFINSKNNLGTMRRLEQREIFNNIINYVRENNIPYLFICGDLYEHNYIRETTIDFINNLFRIIPDTKIFITPGNHDPLLKNSYYNNYNWSENVFIFSSELNIFEFDNVDIYGFGFDDFYFNKNIIENIKIKNTNKINILLTHGSLNASDKLEMQYNPISQNILKSIGFDYVALGHIHKREVFMENIVYPGSAISLGFDELGEHGILDVNLEKNNLKINFLKMDNIVFEEINLDISEIKSEEELIEKINSLNLEKNNYYKLILVGNNKFKFDINKILKINNKKNILKIKNSTRNNFEIEKILKENNLKSIFLEEILNNEKNINLPKEEIEKIIKIGLDAM